MNSVNIRKKADSKNNINKLYTSFDNKSNDKFNDRGCQLGVIVFTMMMTDGKSWRL